MGILIGAGGILFLIIIIFSVKYYIDSSPLGVYKKWVDDNLVFLEIYTDSGKVALEVIRYIDAVSDKKIFVNSSTIKIVCRAIKYRHIEDIRKNAGNVLIKLYGEKNENIDNLKGENPPWVNLGDKFEQVSLEELFRMRKKYIPGEAPEKYAILSLKEKIADLLRKNEVPYDKIDDISGEIMHLVLSGKISRKNFKDYYMNYNKEKSEKKVGSA